MAKKKPAKKKAGTKKASPKARKSTSKGAKSTRKKTKSPKVVVEDVQEPISITHMVIGVLIIVLLVGAYMQFGGNDQEEQSLEELQAPNQVADFDGSTVVATVNGADVTAGSVKELQEFAALRGQQISPQDALEQVVNQLLIEQEATRLGYETSVSEVETLLTQQLESQGNTLEDFKAEIESQGGSYDAVIENYQMQASIEAYLDATITVPEIDLDEAREFYEENKVELAGENPPAFEEVEEKVVIYLQSRGQQQALVELLGSLQQAADVQVK